MPEAKHPDLEARIRDQVDRAVAPYEGVASPVMLAKLRELAERYWRESPVAARALQLQGYVEQTRSDTVPLAAEQDTDEAKEA
jgi:hypothetical protein